MEKKVDRFIKLAKAPETQKEYAELLRKLKAEPKEVGRKLRKATWGEMNADEIWDTVNK